MTVRNIPPIARYTGNGSETVYAWDWDMNIPDSSINVLLDNYNVLRYQHWDLQGQNVVFYTAPDDGAEIIIYRRTVPRQPTNYLAFGRFRSSKTEINMDRQMLIAQERAGDSRHGEPPNGIVGGANLSSTRGEFSHTVVSERGTDAVIPLYNYDGEGPPDPPDPDATIVWAGDDIYGGIYSLAGNTNGVAATIRFRMDLLDGDPTEASAYYPNFNAFAFASWVNVDPDDNEYWMRITEIGTPVPSNRYTINDTVGSRELGEAFQIRGKVTDFSNTLVDRAGEIVVDRQNQLLYLRGLEIPTSVQGPYYSIFTFGDTAPITRTAYLQIEICKDAGGVPDQAWVSRNVTLEAIFNE